MRRVQRPYPADVDTTVPSNTQPAPVPGCKRCTEIAEKRAEAARRRDHSAVSDANVRIGRHPDH